jgi:hypothetical protein
MLRITSQPAFPTRAQRAFVDAHAPAQITPGAIAGDAVVYLQDGLVIERLVLDAQAEIIRSTSYRATAGDLVFG